MFRWDTGHGAIFWLIIAPAIPFGLVWLFSCAINLFSGGACS